jgi:tetratricopeptide (TPR) repeat protein
MALVLAVVFAAPASAQLGRVSGTVRDQDGRPIKSATVIAEHADVAPGSFTAITNDKGQFSMIGLRGGAWRFTASAPGFLASSGAGRIQTIGSNPPIEFRLTKGAAFGGGGRLAGVNARDLEAALAAADVSLDAGRYDEAISGYRQVLAQAPALTLVHLPLGRALRLKRDYDGAIGAYRDWLAADAGSERATVELGLTYLEKGDLSQAEATLAGAAQAESAGREVYFGLAEVKLAQGEPADADRYYQRAADADPTWVKPLLKLGLAAANRGDRDGAARYLDRVVALAPASGEASQARSILEQLRR